MSVTIAHIIVLILIKSLELRIIPKKNRDKMQIQGCRKVFMIKSQMLGIHKISMWKANNTSMIKVLKVSKCLIMAY